MRNNWTKITKKNYWNFIPINTLKLWKKKMLEKNTLKFKRHLKFYLTLSWGKFTTELVKKEWKRLRREEARERIIKIKERLIRKNLISTDPKRLQMCCKIQKFNRWAQMRLENLEDESLLGWCYFTEMRMKIWISSHLR